MPNRRYTLTSLDNSQILDATALLGPNCKELEAGLLYSAEDLAQDIAHRKIPELGQGKRWRFGAGETACAE